MLKAKLTILLLLIVNMTFAQKADLSSPRAAVHTLYDNLQQDSINAAQASKVIYSRQVFSRSKRIDIVKQIKTYLDEQNFVVVFDSIPADPNYKDSISNKNVYTLYNRVSLSRYGKNWYLSKTTVNNIEALLAEADTLTEDGKFANDKLSNKEKRALDRKAREEVLAEIAQMPVDLSSPYATLKFYEENVNVDPAIASRVISIRDTPHLNDRIDIVVKLKRFLDGKGVILDLDKVPDDPDYTDSLKAGKYTFTINYRFADLYLEREADNWYLSKESAAKVPALYNSAFPFGSDRLLKYLPKGGRQEYLGLAAWQYLAILLIIVLIFFVYKFLKWIITYLVTKVMFRFGYKDIAIKYIQPVVSPIGLLLAFLLADASTPFLQLPIKVTAFVSITVGMLIPLYATIAVYRAMDIVSLYMEKLALKTESTFDDQLVPLVRKILKTFVVVIGSIYVLKNLNVDIKLLLGGLSVGGLALALAAQDTIKNFFGSLMIFIDKPFQSGHWIVSSGSGIDGTVEQVGLRSTRIRTFENSVITVPNGKLSDAAINNYGLRAYRRFRTLISVTYDTPPDVLDLFVDGLRDIVKQHPHTRKDYYHVYMNDMGPHSLNILFYIFFITPNWGDELKYRHEIILSIMRLAETLGVNFAFPTQTLHMETFPGEIPLSPAYEPVDKLKRKMDTYFNQHEDPGKKDKE